LARAHSGAISAQLAGITVARPASALPDELAVPRGGGDPCGLINSPGAAPLDI